MSTTPIKSKIEFIKEGSRGLRGSIQEELTQDTSVFSPDTSQLLKFHGIYQQEDRDQRKERSQLRLEKAYQFMVRIKNPGGGRLSPRQWLVLDQASDLYGNKTLRITSRQDVQFHGVGKRKLQKLIQLLNSKLITTYGACGDGFRNIMACPVASIRKDSFFDAQDLAKQISARLAFQSSAYCEIWLNGENITPMEEEPLYGSSYLPRKFKVAIADPHDNCVDVYTNDVGIVPALEKGQIRRAHLLVGGGLGSTHGKKETFPRLATPLGAVSLDEVGDVLEAVLRTFRDLGDRQNRRHARLKYVVEEMGITAFRREVEERLGWALPESEGADLHLAETHLGWHPQKEPGLHYVGLFVENGRVEDKGAARLKTGMREIASSFHLNILLTPRQDLILCDIPQSDVEAIQSELKRFGLAPEQDYSPLRVLSMACPALPTCGLAIAEAERLLPGLISELESRGCGHESVVIRMSGCPNSCSRPPVAEIGLVGKSANGYHVYIGGSAIGTRLAQLYREDVHAAELADLLERLLVVYRKQRGFGERFGDWSHRLGVAGVRRLCEIETRGS